MYYSTRKYKTVSPYKKYNRSKSYLRSPKKYGSGSSCIWYNKKQCKKLIKEPEKRNRKTCIEELEKLKQKTKVDYICRNSRDWFSDFCGIHNFYKSDDYKGGRYHQTRRQYNRSPKRLRGGQLKTNYLSPFRGGSSIPCLAIFKATWCGYCRAMDSELDKLKKNKSIDPDGEAQFFISTPHGNIKIFDSDENKKIFDLHNVNSFPTIRFYSKGMENKDDFIDYTGPRTKKGFEDFMIMKTQGGANTEIPNVWTDF